jgi:hypothetical protein
MFVLSFIVDHVLSSNTTLVVALNKTSKKKLSAIKITITTTLRESLGKLFFSHRCFSLTT